MIKRYFPPVRETVLLVVITLAFLLLTATCIGLRPGSVFCRKDNP